MTRAVRIGEAAAAELADAVRWYEQQRPGVGVQFSTAVERTLRLIEARPGIGSAVPGAKALRARRVVLRRFPYQVIYYERTDEIVVVAVAHTKRRPGYWRRRT